MSKSRSVTERQGEDWVAILDRLAQGDRLAFAKINRLLTQFLVRLHAYDFRDEWEDLRQEVVLSLMQSHRAGKLRNPGAFVAYTRSIVRNKFYNRLSAQERRREKQAVSFERVQLEDLEMATCGNDDGLAHDVWRAVESLSDQQRQVLHALYRNGLTYEQVATVSGIPLGTVKRRLREALEILRQRFRDVL